MVFKAATINLRRRGNDLLTKRLLLIAWQTIWWVKIAAEWFEGSKVNLEAHTAFDKTVNLESGETLKEDSKEYLGALKRLYGTEDGKAEDMFVFVVFTICLGLFCIVFIHTTIIVSAITLACLTVFCYLGSREIS